MIFPQIFHSVRRIAELLIHLQQSGSVKYTGWILRFPCSKDEATIDLLQHRAKKMQADLVEWKKTLQRARKEFYDLNYFTTVQLLTLRRELSPEKGDHSSIPPSVLFLLHSISRKVDSRGVRQLVKNVLTPTAINPSTLNAPSQQSNEAAAPVYQLKAKILVVDDSPKVTSKDRDMPELTENELKDEQREILQYVIKRINCSKNLVLKAFELNKGENFDKFDYRDWCSKHQYDYNFEIEATSDSEEEDDDADDDNDDDEDQDDKPILKDGDLGSDNAQQLLMGM